MVKLNLIALAVAPGLAIGIFIYWKDKWEKEPLHWLLYAFLLGVLSVIPTLLLSFLAQFLGSEPESDTLFISLISCVLGIGLVEEFCKFIFVRWLIFPKKIFNEPFDGITYCVMSAMGFATLENIAFLERFGSDYLLVRAFTAIPAHLVFAVVQGYYLGKAKFKNGGKVSPTERNRLVLYGFLVAFLLHGAYDLLIFQDRWQWLFLLATATTYLCLFYAADMIFEHLEHSPFKKELKQKEPLREE